MKSVLLSTVLLTAANAVPPQTRPDAPESTGANLPSELEASIAAALSAE